MNMEVVRCPHVAPDVVYVVPFRYRCPMCSAEEKIVTAQEPVSFEAITTMLNALMPPEMLMFCAAEDQDNIRTALDAAEALNIELRVSPLCEPHRVFLMRKDRLEKMINGPFEWPFTDITIRPDEEAKIEVKRTGFGDITKS